MMFALLDETSLVLIPLRVFFSLGNKANGKQCARFILHGTNAALASTEREQKC